MVMPPCFHLADEVFPQVRAQASITLGGQGWTQRRIADALGISQAMVSNHQRLEPKAPSALAVRMAADLVQQLTGQKDPMQWCEVLATGEGAEELLEAEQRLVGGGVTALVPQIGMNMALHVDGQVLAFPGRMVAFDGRLVAPAPPRPGASQHLAAVLDAVRAAAPETTCVASIAGGPAVVRAAEKFGAMGKLAGEGDRVAMIAKQASAGLTFYHDAGAFGIEPCLYVVGPDARTVTDTLLLINEAL